MLLQHLFRPGKEPGDKNGGEYAALETNNGSLYAQKAPVLGNSARGNRVGIHQPRMDHDTAKYNSQNGVASKALHCGIGDQHRKEGEGCGNDVQACGKVRDQFALVCQRTLQSE